MRLATSERCARLKAGSGLGYFPITQTFGGLAIRIQNSSRARMRGGRASLKARDEISAGPGRSSYCGVERVFDVRNQMENPMTRVTFVLPALLAPPVCTTQAMAARNEVAARHAAIKAHR